MYKIHPLADVQSKSIGEGTNIWQFCVIFAKAVIGAHCNICANVLIENDVRVGDNVTIKCGVQLWDGITICDNVFIGSNVTFTNDRVPRSKNKNWQLIRTTVHEGASIGANSTILAGCSIGKYAFVGAGSVVTKEVPDFTVWYGNPARMMGYITKEGIITPINNKDEIDIL